MTRLLVAVLTAFVFAACGSAPAVPHQAAPPNAALDPAVEYLLASAADDFHANRASSPAGFRNVRSGYVAGADGKRQYRLCGEFLPAQEGGTAAWARFATIATERYEQWLGAQAAPFCDPSVTWDPGDLSSLLQSRFDSPR